MSWQGYFNTSHVTVYLKEGDGRLGRSNISIHLMLLFIKKETTINFVSRYFNTSHVTVYRRDILNRIVDVSFQYISCYCLSINFETLKICRYYFNTSHVTVYPEVFYLFRLFLRISIHLMLLFIYKIFIVV